MGDAEKSPKKAMTEAERLELAAKLDRELDKFIDSLPKREPQENIPFERWEEEIANHPFFMKEAPQPGDKLHPLYEGLQKLKYDPEENEPEDLAISYKDDGNFNFKHKKYRMAIISYTEGLKAKCGNAEIESTLYNNRSAAHYFLRNYRSALLDCDQALKLKPDYTKALIRAANCCYNLEKYDKGIEYCDKLLEINKEDKEIIELRKKCVNDLKIKERNKRKRELAVAKAQKEEDMLVDEILKRKIKIQGSKGHSLTISKLEPQFPELFNSRVSLDENGNLVWPVILFYPEYKIMDYIQQFNEQHSILEQLEQVFAEFPQWDDEKKYRVNNLNVYFENEQRKNIKIDVSRTLLEILQMEDYVVKDGTPKFIVLVANSRAETQFLKAS